MQRISQRSIEALARLYRHNLQTVYRDAFSPYLWILPPVLVGRPFKDNLQDFYKDSLERVMQMINLRSIEALVCLYRYNL